jgi:hypothetical protein
LLSGDYWPDKLGNYKKFLSLRLALDLHFSFGHCEERSDEAIPAVLLWLRLPRTFQVLAMAGWRE